MIKWGVLVIQLNGTPCPKLGCRRTKTVFVAEPKTLGSRPCLPCRAKKISVIPKTKSPPRAPGGTHEQGVLDGRRRGFQEDHASSRSKNFRASAAFALSLAKNVTSIYSCPRRAGVRRGGPFCLGRRGASAPPRGDQNANTVTGSRMEALWGDLPDVQCGKCGN